jgi:hypothetical protein
MGECVCFLIVIIRKILLKRKLLVISPVHPVLETIIAAAAIAVVRDREPQGLVVQLLRQYMHNTEIAVTMRLSTILKTIKQPL